VFGTDEGTLRVLHTPGHASNHVCFLLEPQGWLFTGDHLMSGSTVVILPPDGSMRLYLESLHRLRKVRLDALLPGHGAAILDPHVEIDRVIAHRLQRERKVADALRRHGAASLEALVPEVYDDTPVALHVLARCSLLAHLQKLLEDGRAAVDGATWSWRES
jgi:glyoxylase-like metal-dependent hydrolase (beta-lactamase superfamily II)